MRGRYDRNQVRVRTARVTPSHALSFAILLLLSVALLAADNAQLRGTQQLRLYVATALMPLSETVAKPFTAVASSLNRITDVFTVYQENQQLKLQMVQLQQWHHAGQMLAQENAVLREATRFLPVPQRQFSTVQIFSRSGGPFANMVQVRYTADDNQAVMQDMAALDNGALAGRVLEAGNRMARILLITDRNARVPVVSLRTGHQFIAAGNGSDVLEIRHLETGAALSNGELVQTSGAGQVFAPAIPVGMVQLQADGSMVILPMADFDAAYLQLLANPVQDTAPSSHMAQLPLKP